MAAMADDGNEYIYYSPHLVWKTVRQPVGGASDLLFGAGKPSSAFVNK